MNVFISGNKLKQKDQLKYLSTVISSDGCNNTEIASRIAQAKKCFQRMKSILRNNHIWIDTHKKPWSAILNPF